MYLSFMVKSINFASETSRTTNAGWKFFTVIKFELMDELFFSELYQN